MTSKYVTLNSKNTILKRRLIILFFFLNFKYSHFLMINLYKPKIKKKSFALVYRL